MSSTLSVLSRQVRLESAAFPANPGNSRTGPAVQVTPAEYQTCGDPHHLAQPADERHGNAHGGLAGERTIHQHHRPLGHAEAARDEPAGLAQQLDDSLDGP